MTVPKGPTPVPPPATVVMTWPRLSRAAKLKRKRINRKNSFVHVSFISISDLVEKKLNLVLNKLA
jgi:hypothetical protein